MAIIVSGGLGGGGEAKRARWEEREREEKGEPRTRCSPTYLPTCLPNECYPPQPPFMLCARPTYLLSNRLFQLLTYPLSCNYYLPFHPPRDRAMAGRLRSRFAGTSTNKVTGSGCFSCDHLPPYYLPTHPLTCPKLLSLPSTRHASRFC